MILDSALAIGLALPPATPVQLDIAPTDPLSRVVPQLERAIAGLARMRSIHLTPDAITVRA